MVTFSGTCLNIQTLQKGDYISPIVVEEHTGVERDSKPYAFALLDLKGEIEAALRLRDGHRVTVKTEGDGIRVLTDSEAAEYNANQVDQSKRRIFRAHTRNKDVDEANLTPSERQEHYRELELGSRYVQSLREIRKENIQPVSHKRVTPGL